MRRLVLLALVAFTAAASAQDLSVTGTWQDAPATGSGFDDLRIFHADGVYRELHPAPSRCRPYLAERHGAWTLDGDTLVVTFSRTVRVTGGTAVEHDGGCHYEAETRTSERDRSSVRWRMAACTADEAAASDARCLRLAGRAWYRLGDETLVPLPPP